MDFAPVRKIRISTRSITGLMPDIGQYESSLERDFMELVRFDKNIKLYTPQPVIIKYLDASGRVRRYTPDGLIQYRRDIEPAKSMPDTLCEVKYRDDFKAGLRELLPRFRAAKAYAAERGWKFQVYTEREIRTAYLANIRFLWPYGRQDIDPPTASALLEKIAEVRESDPDALLLGLFRDKWNRAAAIPVLWHLIARGEVGCELDMPLTMRSRIWTLEG